jgi:hypothetical protein
VARSSFNPCLISNVGSPLSLGVRVCYCRFSRVSCESVVRLSPLDRPERHAKNETTLREFSGDANLPERIADCVSISVEFEALRSYWSLLKKEATDGKGTGTCHFHRGLRQRR